MKIGIYAEGSNKIGMGHIMRTLVLAKEFAKTWEVFYICSVNNYETKENQIGVEKITSENFIVKLVDRKTRVQEMLNLNLDILIIDSYDVDEDFFNNLKNKVKLLVYIDDLNLIKINADIIINQNINAIDFNYKTNRNTKLLLGTDYLLLREEFQSVKEKTINKKVENIMITMGGSDPYDFSESLVNWLQNTTYKIHLVVGSGFKNIVNLKNLEKNNPKLKLYFNAKMKELMELSDIAISACGSSLYELCACGVPTIGVILAENQRGHATKLAKLDVLKLLGDYKDITENKFITALIDLANDYDKRIEINKKAVRLVNGFGAQRIKQEIEHYLEEGLK